MDDPIFDQETQVAGLMAMSAVATSSQNPHPRPETDREENKRRKDLVGVVQNLADGLTAQQKTLDGVLAAVTNLANVIVAAAPQATPVGPTAPSQPAQTAATETPMAAAGQADLKLVGTAAKSAKMVPTELKGAIKTIRTKYEKVVRSFVKVKKTVDKAESDLAFYKKTKEKQDGVPNWYQTVQKPCFLY